MTLTQLEIFALVAEMQGFTAAAARLGISQSGVSHAVRELERELGVELLQRRQGRVELTDIGRQLLPRASGMLGLAEAMRQEAADARGLRRGTLRIGSFGPTSSMRLLPALLARYRQQYPGIEVHIDEGPDEQVLQWLLERRVDIAFAVLPDPRFVCCPLVEDQMVAVLPAGHRLADRPRVTLAELCGEPFALSGAGSAELVMRLFQAARLQPNIRYRCGQLLSTLDTVARGDAVAIVAELSLPSRPHAEGYVGKPLQPAVRRQVGLALLDGDQASPAARAFLQIADRLRIEGGLAGLNARENGAA
ncbi:LysR family transcriptional regulator [Chromobacterium violaceum]|uniref:LysR family transcriptional regulator n=3 Tax=Chromobacterium violaceum TaxID=536 RepID=A0A202BFU3_CHRVL|nr:LysR substrate-binding domain-containing protein [Chromobacterium violaceum]AAQ61804.1 probable transcriptional regulator, LysR family [Chromobacterium violaceum ATCC 12472]MBA8733816.1 LysR family transcriptional regulator [Chromobacterium violaceum]MBP4047096.1 LysR family transcriptional regulator [Chromobacterium violaceum]MBT2866183.1 LysR family transcriptional regulator [Chromobacterium violaceum]OVE50270.1 LysR family transcriptional regulator [Chromobacterium violaceum]